MRQKVKLAIAAAILGCMIAACGPRQTTSLHDLLSAENMEQFNKQASQVKSQGIDGIPLFLAVIDDSLETKHNLFSYGKLNASITHLHDLASDGVYTVDSVPVLIRAVEEQVAITDTLVTAETLQMITGVDTRYNEDFVTNYRVEDEERRQEMISKWRRWYATNSADDH